MSIIIRTATPQDAAALCEIYAPYVRETAVSFEYEPPSATEFKERMKNIQSFFPYLVAEEAGKIVGYAYAHSFHERAAYRFAAETTVYVQSENRGKGIGKALYQEIISALKQQGYVLVVALVATTDRANDAYLTAASCRFHEHMGFTLCGTMERCGYKFERWYGMCYYIKRLEETTEKVSEPIPFDVIR